MQRKIGRAPNYTSTCLVMGFVNLFWVLVVIWVAFGLPAVMLVGVALNWLITRLAVRRGLQP